uniref:Uncharacterized protein n=1 Tax=Lepeophtheirus salmonis TaxID=72036 RepID=A0A0K2SV24_LEPSM
MSSEKLSLSQKSSILHNAALKALNGGTSGAMAMGIQVTTLMWMRTTMNYQYRYGTTTSIALKALYADGGIRRFYRGFLPALFQGPLSRFGDTAANVGILALLEPYDVPVFLKTAAASVSAGLWRIAIMPIDTTKTTLQVEGVTALPQLKDKIKVRGPLVLYHGSLAAASATMAGHFPWFLPIIIFKKLFLNMMKHIRNLLAMLLLDLFLQLFLIPYQILFE